MAEQDFLKWRSSLDEWYLFFDGASKGNPGKAGGGGIILEPTGSTKLSFAWGLGFASNNQAEFLALWQGLTQVVKLGIKEVTIVGESKQVVDALNFKKIPKDMRLAHLYKKTLLLLEQLNDYKIYHVLRLLNGQADKEANQGTSLNKGHLKINGETSHHSIP